MRRVLGVVLGGVVLIAGCGGDDDDDDATSAPEPSASPSAAPEPELRVPFPKDVSALVTDPCTAFTADQLAPFELAPDGELTRKPSERSREKCMWDGIELFGPSASLLVERFASIEDAFGYAYASVNKKQERVQIGGNPASLGQVFEGDTQCDAATVVSDTEVLLVVFTKPARAPGDPCGPARELAEFAMGNLAPLTAGGSGEWDRLQRGFA